MSFRHSPSTGCRHTVSGSISLPSRGSFHLSLTVLRSLSVSGEYLALGGGAPCFPQELRFPWYSGRKHRKSFPFRLRGYHPLWPAFPDRSAMRRICNFPAGPQPRPCFPPQPRIWNACGLFPKCGLGSSAFARRYSRNRILLSFPLGTEMVHFPRFASYPYVFRIGCRCITSGGFPHSGIPGSTPACGSPRLIAACHALHRFPLPRHPPYALSNLTTHLRSPESRFGFQRASRKGLWWR